MSRMRSISFLLECACVSKVRPLASLKNACRPLAPDPKHLSWLELPTRIVRVVFAYRYSESTILKHRRPRDGHMHTKLPGSPVEFIGVVPIRWWYKANKCDFSRPGPKKRSLQFRLLCIYSVQLLQKPNNSRHIYRLLFVLFILLCSFVFILKRKSIECLQQIRVCLKLILYHTGFCRSDAEQPEWKSFFFCLSDEFGR